MIKILLSTLEIFKDDKGKLVLTNVATYEHYRNAYEMPNRY